MSVVRGRMVDPLYLMRADSRLCVLAAMKGHCAYRGWLLLAAHVRTNHAHVVLEAEVRPERIMNELKAYASRELNRVEGIVRRRWARHGSTRWLWHDADVMNAVRYVVDEQGLPMALFVAEGI